MATTSFDFSAYNNLIRTANSGLRLHLAIRLLEDVESTMRRFNSPLKSDAYELINHLTDLQKRNREYLAKRENTTDGDIDSQESMKKPSNSADAGKVA